MIAFLRTTRSLDGSHWTAASGAVVGGVARHAEDAGGDVFVALKTDKRDRHDFLADAAKPGRAPRSCRAATVLALPPARHCGTLRGAARDRAGSGGSGPSADR